MATTWYFRDTNASVGPTAKAAIDTDDFPSVPSDKNTPKDMTVASGSGQTSIVGAYVNTGHAMARIFVGPALATQTLIGGQSGYQVAIGIKESSAQMNLTFGIFVYLWSPLTGPVYYLSKGTGALIFCNTEHGIAETEDVITFTGNAPSWLIQNGERIVVETWFYSNNTKDTSYNATFYYDGTDTTMVDDTPTTNAGSYFYCSQTLNLYTPPSTYIKTINGLLKASVKTVNGLVIANVKSWNGLT